ncbi:AP-1 complex-associated regulatory -like isoform X3 [Labeo rohita]|uniref:AP-1 complex-associated regulatory-like isoform X3 n=1 Tax=Labeo rohita TaxID=84645 RepID=A0A498NYF4_LABRO|nr:AP-1 complex-associated regulatory -like isoform X3 [Labeo rohita]
MSHFMCSEVNLHGVSFENLVESDEGESSQSCPRPISEEEIVHLKEHRYTAISDKQTLIDQKLNAEVQQVIICEINHFM